MYEKLPNDVKQYIKLFLYAPCDHCFFLNYFWKLKHDITMYEYITIFNELYTNNPLNFKCICDYCYELHLNSHYYVTPYILGRNYKTTNNY